MTLFELIELHYWPEHALTIKPQSLDQLRYSVAAFKRHLGREPQLTDLQKLVVIGFLAARKNSVSPATVNKDRRALLCLWRHAAESELVPWPPRIPKARQPSTIPHTFTHEQVQRLVKASTKMPDHTLWRSLILALYDTGSRISAMVSVRISDVDIERRLIRLQASNSKTMTEQVVDIAQDTTAAIAAQILGREDDDFVWPFRSHHRQLFVWFRRLAEMADVPLPKGKAFHSLRRTTCTLVAKLFSVEAAQRQLGHSSVQTTKKYIDSTQFANLRIADQLPRPS